MKNKKETNPTDYQTELVRNHTNTSHTFCQNVNICKEKSGVTIHDICDGTGLREDIVKSVLYYKNETYSVGIASKMAKYFKISMDELCGAETLQPGTIKAIHQLRNLNPAFKDFICQIIQYMYKTMENKSAREKSVPMICPPCDEKTGNLRHDIRNITAPLNISFIDEGIRSKIIMAVKIPCTFYQPKFWQNDILLLAKDRAPRPNEVVVLIMGESLWFAYIRNKKLYSIIDEHYCAEASEADDVLGYVSHVIRIN